VRVSRTGLFCVLHVRSSETYSLGFLEPKAHLPFFKLHASALPPPCHDGERGNNSKALGRLVCHQKITNTYHKIGHIKTRELVRKEIIGHGSGCWRLGYLKISMEKRLLLVLLAFALFALGVFIHGIAR